MRSGYGTVGFYGTRTRPGNGAGTTCARRAACHEPAPEVGEGQVAIAPGRGRHVAYDLADSCAPKSSGARMVVG